MRMWGLSNSLGFTLLELLVTLILLSLLTAIGARFLIQPETSAALAKINTMLEQVRFQAMRENRRIDLNCEDIAVTAPRGENLTCQFNFFLPRTSKTLAFYPDGSSNGGHIIWRRQGKTDILSIDWLTGSVSHAHP